MRKYGDIQADKEGTLWITSDKTVTHIQEAYLVKPLSLKDVAVHSIQLSPASRAPSVNALCKYVLHLKDCFTFK